MSDYGTCKTCGQWGYKSYHTCPPIFFVWDDEIEEDGAFEIRSSCHQYAVETFAEMVTEDDEERTAYNSDKVYVRKFGEEEVKVFSVETDWNPSASAWEEDNDSKS